MAVDCIVNSKLDWSFIDITDLNSRWVPKERLAPLLPLGVSPEGMGYRHRCGCRRCWRCCCCCRWWRWRRYPNLSTAVSVSITELAECDRCIPNDARNNPLSAVSGRLIENSHWLWWMRLPLLLVSAPISHLQSFHNRVQNLTAALIKKHTPRDKHFRKMCPPNQFGCIQLRRLGSTN